MVAIQKVATSFSEQLELERATVQHAEAGCVLGITAEHGIVV